MRVFVELLAASTHLPVSAIRTLGLIPSTVSGRARTLRDFEDVSPRSVVVVVRFEAHLILPGRQSIDRSFTGTDGLPVCVPVFSPLIGLIQVGERPILEQMRTLVLDLDTCAFASDITPRNSSLLGRPDLDFNRPTLCHIAFRGDAVIDRYGENLALAIALNVRIARSLRRPFVALINAVLNLHVGRGARHRDVDSMRLPIIVALESLCRHVLELRASNGPVCTCRARVVAHALDIELVVRVIGIGAGRIDRAHRAIRGITINLVVAALDEG